MAHTPGPWACNSDGVVWTRDPSVGIRNIVCAADNPADAALIVRAVNAHAALLAACEALFALNYPVCEADQPAFWAALDAVRAALILAKGE